VTSWKNFVGQQRSGYRINLGNKYISTISTHKIKRAETKAKNLEDKFGAQSKVLKTR
jgi:hypothetical protein